MSGFVLLERADGVELDTGRLGADVDPPMDLSSEEVGADPDVATASSLSVPPTAVLRS